jgi:hypothetical protein
MSRFRISRRKLLGAVATTAVASVVLARDTSVFTRDENRLALLDGMLSGDDLARARITLAPLQPRTLQPDLLWQWRRELAQELATGVRAIAITRWDKAILLNGLAREAALPVRQRRIGHSLFQTEIG